ncbi:uncharacterized protein THITE_2110843 [Thermothielavioides terrestris NRRL 8126]|uniref:Uncharacterized protein n=1 Tax=Thermothielavioides terrestris (strain ATCC 38088 / NRRL 8126) TaxID=578455 RepID=G2QUL1_THETT|nr:uncharacterized protein THITE_2110843 [Thermothielavioides terrestris NRRL 8126]AEO64566.1 hypothetical protein THITE_2110843 [Thermothielavioides terrestris NRRL 8126]
MPFWAIADDLDLSFNLQTRRSRVRPTLHSTTVKSPFPETTRIPGTTQGRARPGCNAPNHAGDVIRAQRSNGRQGEQSSAEARARRLVAATRDGDFRYHKKNTRHPGGSVPASDWAAAADGRNAAPRSDRMPSAQHGLSAGHSDRRTQLRESDRGAQLWQPAKRKTDALMIRFEVLHGLPPERRLQTSALPDATRRGASIGRCLRAYDGHRPPPSRHWTTSLPWVLNREQKHVSKPRRNNKNKLSW